MSANSFKGVYHIGEDTISPIIEKSVIAWLDWCSMGVGGYFNVSVDQSGAYGGNWSKLHLADATEEGFAKGKVWEGVRKNWVYESGVSYSVPPIQITGIYVNSTFYGTGTNVPVGSGWNVNYPLGRVEFDYAMPTGTVIKLDYSHKYYSFESSKVGWFRELAYKTFSPEEETLEEYGSGVKTVLNHNRIQLPAVVAEVQANTKFLGLMLGGGQYVYKSIKFHIFAETPWECTKMVDILTTQNETTINGLHFNMMAANSGMPLTADGYTWSGTKNYPQLLSSFPWGTIRLFNMGAYDDGTNHFLTRAVVEGTCELSCPRL